MSEPDQDERTVPHAHDVPERSTDPRAPGLPGERYDHPGDTPAAYWRAFSVVAFTMNRFIVDHVLRSSRLFEDDIEAMILFGALSHLNVAHMIPPGARPSGALDETGRLPDPQPHLRPIRLRDLVQITGRPRETIRRKLERLQAEGRVHRLADGWVLDVASIDRTMQAVSADGVRRFMEAARVIESALRDAERALAAPAAPGGRDPARPSPQR